MRTVQEDGGPSLSQIIQNGQRPLWFSCRMPSLSAHAVLHMPDSCHLPLDGICGQTQHHQQNQPSIGSPCTTSLEQRRSAGSSGPVNSPRPTTTTAHTGPKPAPALALALRRFTGQTQPEPHDNKGHQKEKKQSHTPVAVCREGTRPCRVPGQPSTHGHSEKSRESSAERHLAPPLQHHCSLGPCGPEPWREGRGLGREDKTACTLRDTQLAFLPRELSAEQVPGLSRDLYNTPQEECFQALLWPCDLQLDTAWSWGPFCHFFACPTPQAAHPPRLDCPSHEEARLKRACLKVRGQVPVQVH